MLIPSAIRFRPKNEVQECLLASFSLRRSFLVNVGLKPSLVGLASIVLLLVLGSSALVSEHAVDSLANGAADTVLDTLIALRQDALGLLALTLLVQVAALLLQALTASQIANELLGTTTGLLHVPSHLVLVVLGDARRGDSTTGYFDRGLGSVMLEVSIIFLDFALGLAWEAG